MRGSDETFYWLSLGRVHGIGCHTFKNLIEHFGSPKKVFDASLKELLHVEGIGRETAERIRSFRGWKDVEEELERVREKGIRIITMKDGDYPSRLKEIYDPPPFLYVKGDLHRDERAIAVVGSRRASPYGLGVAHRMAMELASLGFTIVSGMARGIDSQAHRGALMGGGRTVAILGSGVDVVYPAENKALYREIEKRGAVVSEFPLSTPPHGRNFPRRNRIISGLSLGVLVVEASCRSGSLITARLALEQGREVFAIPGSITSGWSKGTNALIKEGAKLVQGVEDIVEEIGLPLAREGGFETGLTDRERLLYNALEEPEHIDIIIKKTGLKPEEVYLGLLNLESKGLIAEYPGKIFGRKG